MRAVFVGAVLFRGGELGAVRFGVGNVVRALLGLACAWRVHV